MTKTVSILLAATLNGEDAPTVAEQQAILLRLIHNIAELLPEKYGIGLTYDVGATAARPDADKPAKTRGPRLTAERVHEFVAAPEGWAKASVAAGYTTASIRQAAGRFEIELPSVRKRAPAGNGVDHHAASSAP